MFTSFIAQPASTSLVKRVAASAAALAMVFMAGSAALPARASDLDYSAMDGTQSDGSQFLRIGLYKSAVLKLPVPAKEVIVGDPAVVDVVIRNKTTAYFFGRTAAQTNVFFFDENGNQILSMDIDVTMDTKALQKLIDRTIPGNRIKVDTAGANVVLKGTAQNATEAALAQSLAEKMAPGENTVVNALKIAEGDQVMLKVKVVEVKRDVLKSFGINLDTFFSYGNVTGAFTTANPVIGSALSGLIGYSNDNFSIDAAIEALEIPGADQDARRAQPDRRVGSEGPVPGRRPVPLHQRHLLRLQQHQLREHRDLQGLWREARLHPVGPERGPHQPQDRDGSQRAG